MLRGSQVLGVLDGNAPWGYAHSSTLMVQNPGRARPLTVSPGLVRGRLLPELLGQVLHSLQPPDLVEQPLLVTLFRLLQPLPGPGDVLGV